MASSGFRCGVVAITGKPNVGKSTLLNRLVGEKVSIISSKPETTRDRIAGILTRPETQVIFVDTPGIHRPKRLLGKQMVRTARSVLMDVDLILAMIDGFRITPDDEELLRLVSEAKAVRFLLINKVDRLKPRTRLLPLIDRLAKLATFHEIIPISATRGDNLDRLLPLIIDALPEHAPLYPEDQWTDRSERFLVRELIREQILGFTHAEIPHAVAVSVDDMTERSDRLTYIRATIFVERESHKAILIGTKGAMLGRIGSEARQHIEELLGRRTFLDLYVKTLQNWRTDPRALKQLGYVE